MPHRALEVDEILREVTAWAVAIHPSTAVALACCAKSFEEPALSELWKTRKGLPTLVKTLPPDSWEVQLPNSDGGKGNITLTRIPSKDEWIRFQRYASWVKTLYVTSVLTISDDVFQQLSSATSGGPVCPQLRRLTWTSSHGWGHMQWFLSPYLVSVLLYREGETESHAGLASTISHLPTAHLEELELNQFSSPTLRSALSEVVQRLNTCFKVLVTESSLSDAAWKHLTSLPKLRLLWVSDTPSTEMFESTPHKNAFPALERVKIKVDNLRQHWSFFFSLLESSPLQQVAVTNREIKHVDVPSQVTIAMLKTKLPLSVNTLKFTGFDPANLTFISNLRPFGSLKALWCNTRCQGLGRCVSPLTDSDIEQLANGLPQLVTIWLGHECKYWLHSTTIKSMISLSTHCLSLKTLRLPCNFTEISEDVKAESGEPDPRLKIRSPCVLRFFAFQWVTMPPPEDIEALRIVASALHHLFPRLWLKDETGAAWKATLDMVKDFRRGELDTAHTM